jgi:hypothetical protein
VSGWRAAVTKGSVAADAEPPTMQFVGPAAAQLVGPGIIMSVWTLLKAFFGRAPLDPAPGRWLDGSSEAALAASIKWLPIGVRGWITMEEARVLFSRMSDQYAFGELDKRGKLKLSAFAENADRCCHVDIMPGEGRIYFTRQG